MALTVADIADLIRRPEVKTAAVVERLRAWTDLGLLEPEGDPNPGTGIKRMYDDDIVYRAAVLNALADAGLPIGKQRHAVVVLFVAERAKAAWAKKRRGGLFMEVCDFGDPDHQGGRHAVFLREANKAREHLGNVIHPRADSAVVLNISRLFARIESRRAERGKAIGKGSERG